MNEWPRICTDTRCKGQVVPATDEYRHPTEPPYYLCERHGKKWGSYLRRQGYTWQRIPQK